MPDERSSAQEAPSVGSTDGQGRSRANLRPPWKPGQSGNPSGRPKGPCRVKRRRDLMKLPVRELRQKAEDESLRAEDLVLINEILGSIENARCERVAAINAKAQLDREAIAESRAQGGGDSRNVVIRVEGAKVDVQAEGGPEGDVSAADDPASEDEE